MARKGTIIKDSSGGGDGSNMVSSSGSTSALSAPTVTYTLTDDKSGESFTFDQPYGHALGFRLNEVVRFETLKVPGTTQEVIITARRFQAGTVSAITDNSNGTLTEKITGKRIPFYQPYLKEQGIVNGTDVKYDLVSDGKGGDVAVNLEANV